jgi:hypothetical protein
MPTRYWAALAGKVPRRRRTAVERDGHGRLVSVCASIDRLAFRRLYWPFASEPALLQPTINIVIFSARSDEVKGLHSLPHHMCLLSCVHRVAYQAPYPPYQGKHYCCYVLTDWLPRSNKDRNNITYSCTPCSTLLPACHSIRPNTPNLPSNHHITAVLLPSRRYNGFLLPPIQRPRLDAPLFTRETEPPAFPIYKRQRDQDARA